MSDGLAPLRQLVDGFSDLLDGTTEERVILDRGRALLGELIARDDWLPGTHARADPDRYSQYLLHRDPTARFSVVSFVWGPGQSTPIHDHTVWGLVGVLRGAEIADSFALDGGVLRLLGTARLKAGDIEAVSPSVGDLHKVSNGRIDGPSVSIHVYGGDIGAVRRSTYDPSGKPRPFVSGYSAAPALVF